MKIEDYFKYYIQGSDHYLIPKNVFIELFQERTNWKDKTKASENARKDAIELIQELYDETDDLTCYEINKNRKEMLLDILDIDKGE